MYGAETSELTRKQPFRSQLRSQHLQEGLAEGAQEIPTPLLTRGHPVNWWFVFKFNSSVFPGCSGEATRTCPFGGEVQNYRAFSQRSVYAKAAKSTRFKRGNDCAG